MRRWRGEFPPPRRPRLNGYRLAKFADRIFNDPSEAEWRELAGGDWRSFVHRRFVLTDGQREALDAVDDDSVARIAETVRQLIKNGGQLQVTLPEAGKGGEIVFSRIDEDRNQKAAGAQEASQARRITIPVMKCSFDANCRNWKCRPGLQP
jgi:hypothetical protein